MAIERDKDVYQQFARLYDEIHKKVIGNEEAVEAILIAIFTGGHVLLESVPGLGKTVLVNAISKTLNCDFKRVQCNPDLSALDVIGKRTYDDEKEKYKIVYGPIFTNLLLVDEVNRAPSRTQSALLEAMEEYRVSIGGEGIPLPQPFTVLATQNPKGMAEGTVELPKAQIDRFMFKVILKYLSREQEIEIVKSKLRHEEINPIFNPAEILIIKEQIMENVDVPEQIMDYLIRVTEATRDIKEIQVGSSPRAEISFMRACKARAFFEGRDYITVSDVMRMAYPILRHRMVLTPEAAEIGVTSDQLIKKLLKQVEAPME